MADVPVPPPPPGAAATGAPTPTPPQRSAPSPAPRRARGRTLLLLLLPAVLLGILAGSGTTRPADCAHPNLGVWTRMLQSIDPALAVEADGPDALVLTSPHRDRAGRPQQGHLQFIDARCATSMVGPPQVDTFLVWPQALGNDELGAQMLTAVQTMAARRPPAPVSSPGLNLGGWRPVADLLGLWILLAGLLRWRQGRGPLVESRLRINHFLPGAIQGSLLLIWALGCVHLRSQAPSILLQLLFGFALDIALGLTIHGRWRAGVAPVPIVLSLHFFAWFVEPPQAVLVIGLALLSKFVFQRRDPGGGAPRPVFNPSAFGLAVYAVLYALWPGRFPFESLVHHAEPVPFLSLFIILFAAVPLTRFPLALVSLGAVIGRSLLHNLTAPGLMLPSTVIALCLLITEPRSLPARPLARLLTGVLYGVLLVVFSQLFVRAGLGDDLSKIAPIPLLNLLAPALDTLALRVERALPRLVAPLAPAHRRRHFLAFALWALATMATADGGQRLALPVWVEGIPTARWAPGGLACSDRLAACWGAVLGLPGMGSPPAVAAAAPPG